MNMISPIADTGTLTRMSPLPGLGQFGDTTVQDHPSVVWHIDATSGRAIGRWVMLPKRPARL